MPYFRRCWSFPLSDPVRYLRLVSLSGYRLSAFVSMSTTPVVNQSFRSIVWHRKYTDRQPRDVLEGPRRSIPILPESAQVTSPLKACCVHLGHCPLILQSKALTGILSFAQLSPAPGATGRGLYSGEEFRCNSRDIVPQSLENSGYFTSVFPSDLITVIVSLSSNYK